MGFNKNNSNSILKLKNTSNNEVKANIRKRDIVISDLNFKTASKKEIKEIKISAYTYAF